MGKKSAYDQLSKTDRRLVDVYLSNGMVQWKAYRDVIYTGDGDTKTGREVCRTKSSRKFADGNIQAAIEERLVEIKMSATEALHRLAAQARNDFSDYIDEDGTVDLAGMIEDGNAHLIREIDYKGKDADRMVVRTHDVQAALDKILKAHGAYVQKHEVSGADGQPIVFVMHPVNEPPPDAQYDE